MLQQQPLVRQERRAQFYRINVSRKFPRPKFSIGDLVCTADGDSGQVLGMILHRGKDRMWWCYKLDLYMDSPGFWEKQGDMLLSDWVEEIAPCPDYYEEDNLSRIE